MNFFQLYISRMIMMVAMGLFMLVMQSLGMWIQQRRLIPYYETLGTAVADPETVRMEWLLWPPQVHVIGKFHGRPFKYEKVDPRTSHLMVECMPVAEWHMSAHHRWSRPRGLSTPDLDRAFPGWRATYASRKPIPFWKHSTDRRALGFGSAPGIDLLRLSSAVNEAGLVRTDLQNLLPLCEAS